MAETAVRDDPVTAGIQMVPFERLDFETVSMRARLDYATVTRYCVAMMEDGVELPPILVFWDGEEYWVADGGHRMEAAVRLGRSEILAEVRLGSRKDARWASFGANARHGLQRTVSEKRAEVETAVREFPERSTADIARQCQVSEQFVRNMRAELEPETNGVSQTTRLNARGQRRPAHIRHPGRKPKLIMVPRTPETLPPPSGAVTREPAPASSPAEGITANPVVEAAAFPPREDPVVIRRRKAMDLLWEWVNQADAGLEGLNHVCEYECRDLLDHWQGSPEVPDQLWRFLASARPMLWKVYRAVQSKDDVPVPED